MRARRQPRLKVLMFHGLVRDLPAYATFGGTNNYLMRERDFERCVRWCARTHKVITLAEVPRYLSGETTDPAILITFDDGLASVIDLAVPVLERYGVSAVVFVTTGWVDSGEAPAIFRLERSLWEAPPVDLRVRVGELEFAARVGERSAAKRALAGLWRFCLAKHIPPLSIQATSVLFDGKPWEPSSCGQDRHFWFPANWPELADAARAGVLEIGAHGVSHTPWTWLSREDRRRELGSARDRLRDLTGFDVRACSYPHGLHDADTRADARATFDWSFTSEGRPVGADDLPNALPRYFVPGARPVLMDAILSWPQVGRVLRKGASLVGWN